MRGSRGCWGGVGGLFVVVGCSMVASQGPVVGWMALAAVGLLILAGIGR